MDITSKISAISAANNITIKKSLIWVFSLFISISLPFSTAIANTSANADSSIQQEGIVSSRIDPSQKTLQFFYLDSNKLPYKNVRQLKKALAQQNKTLRFATNGGIFMENLTPLGLYIENGKQLAKINKIKKAFGNFYIQPNGILQISKKGNASIVQTTKYKASSNTDFALQSGPLLVIDGKINRRFIPDSDSRKIRNGVGILDNGDLVFAMATKRINFHDFGQYFINIGCKQALYLDGSISMFYHPEQGRNYSGGRYSAIIAEVIDNQ